MKERIAQEGYWLTQATIDDESSRTFAHKVAGFGDLDSLFAEWTDEQKEQWESEHHEDENEEISDSEALEIITGKI